MILIKLMGGIGNQLFQYAYGRALSLKKKDDLRFDTSWYKGRIDRKYSLKEFNISGKEASWFSQLFDKSFPLIDTQGAWHSEKFFKDYENIIREELTLKRLGKKAEEVLQTIKDKNAVSIHLRGGDYVRGNKSNFHGVASAQYYSRAIEYIKSKQADVHFFIFTDDIEWARSHISFPEPHTLVSDGSIAPHEELALMAACKHNIIANSTFSWWGAWLNPNKSKIVISPSKWFADEKVDTSDILPSTWIRI